MGGLLAGCGQAPDMLQAGAAGPRAAACSATIDDPQEMVDVFRDTRVTRLRVGNDGGWCGTYLRLRSDNVQQGWSAGSVTRPPAHGTVRLRSEGATVHVEYRPQPGYAGADSFEIRMQPGYATRRTDVEVTQPSAASGGGNVEIGITSAVSYDDPSYSADQ